MLSPSDLRCLSELLRAPDEDSSDEDLPRAGGHAKTGPGDIGRKSEVKVKAVGGEDPEEIWGPNEVAEVARSDDAVWDSRARPTYRFLYNQALTAQDLFLQMSNKTPTTASCEFMIIIISLEGESKDGIDCHIERATLDIRSPLYRLNLPLPHPVNPSTARAEWDPSTSELSVKLQLDREYDFINF